MIINAIENYEEISPFDEMTVGEGFPLPPQKVVVFLTKKLQKSEKRARRPRPYRAMCLTANNFFTINPYFLLEKSSPFPRS